MKAADILRERAANLDAHSEGMRATGCPSYERIIEDNNRLAAEWRAVAELMDAAELVETVWASRMSDHIALVGLRDS